MSAARAAAAALLVAALFAPGASALSAQTLVGRVLDEVRDSPVAGAAVRLLDREGGERASAVSDPLGRFTLKPPRGGEYYLAAERIGYEAARSPLLALSEEGTAALDLMMAPAPLGLEGIEVDVEAEAAEDLRLRGIDPASLGSSFITQDQIDAIEVKRDVGVILEWSQIGGMRVVRPENRTGGGGAPSRSGAEGAGFAGMCVSLVRGRTAKGTNTCALPVLDGLPIDNERLLYLDPESIAAIAVLQPLDARILYGTRADHGAVLFWTKRGR